MGIAHRYGESWKLARRALGRRLAPRCGHPDCRATRSLWRRVRSRLTGIRLAGVWYCRPECLERALAEAIHGQLAPVAISTPRRIPLGLVLLSRQQITAEQLQAGLEAQRAAGHGRIGEWLERLGFVNEQQVTAALARQWRRPVLRPTAVPRSQRIPEIPARLLESFRMFPVDYVEATATLHIAFAERIDYSLMYAIGQILGCRVEPCLAAPTLLGEWLRGFSHPGRPREAVFDRVAGAEEMARIIRSYAAKVGAVEVRLARCGFYIWARLERPAPPPFHLVLATAAGSPDPSPFASNWGVDHAAKVPPRAADKTRWTRPLAIPAEALPLSQG
jgi:hypothetical protein